MLVFCHLFCREYLRPLLLPQRANRIGARYFLFKNVLLQLKESGRERTYGGFRQNNSAQTENRTFVIAESFSGHIWPDVAKLIEIYEVRAHVPPPDTRKPALYNSTGP